MSPPPLPTRQPLGIADLLNAQAAEDATGPPPVSAKRDSSMMDIMRSSNSTTSVQSSPVPGQRGRGRPPVPATRSFSMTETTGPSCLTSFADSPPTPTKRSPGRPKGSKNKPKDPNAPRGPARSKTGQNAGELQPKTPTRMIPSPVPAATSSSSSAVCISGLRNYAAHTLQPTSTLQPAASLQSTFSPRSTFTPQPTTPSRPPILAQCSTARPNPTASNQATAPTRPGPVRVHATPRNHVRSARRDPRALSVSQAIRLANWGHEQRRQDFWQQPWFNTARPLNDGAFAPIPRRDLYAMGDDLRLATFSAADIPEMMCHCGRPRYPPHDHTTDYTTDTRTVNPMEVILDGTRAAELRAQGVTTNWTTSGSL